MMLPTHTASAVLVVDPSIQVCTAPSVVPVFPISGRPSRGLAAVPVPPLVTPASTYATVFAISGERACVQSFACPGSSFPSGPTILSIAIGLQ